MYNIYKISNIIEVIGMLSALISIGYIWNFLKRKEVMFLSDALFVHFPEKIKLFLSIMCHVVMIASVFLSNSFFITNILHCDDIRIRPEGAYCYYVEATSEENKTYILPARVCKEEGSIPTDNGWKDMLLYDITNVYFENGGYLYFEHRDLFDYDEKVYAIDQNGLSWDLQIINKQTSHPMVEETSNYSYSPTDVVLNILFCVVHICAIFVHIKVHKAKNYI